MLQKAKSIIIDNKTDCNFFIVIFFYLIYISQDYLNLLLTFKNTKSKLLIYNYQYDRELIGNEFPIEYHILDYKDELIEFLMFVVKQKLFNFNKRIKCNGNYCSRLIYHIAYNVFILQNNSPILTEEQLKIVQQIHDYQMPIEYVDTLTSMIYTLKYPEQLSLMQKTIIDEKN